jgi:uncharacterized protein YkwD
MKKTATVLGCITLVLTYVLVNAGGVSAASHSLSSEVLFQKINNHRAKIGLPAFQKDERICQVAQSRAPELYREIFVTRRMHQGFYGRKLPYWATENMIHQNTEDQAFNWWMRSYIHRKAIQGNYKYACGACSGKSCAMIFTSFQPKKV